jgi:ATP-dependent Lhr-like helicase
LSNKDLELLNRLHPTVQRAILKKWKNQKGFREVQRQAIPIITEGKSCLIISPTAGGKTEAAILPVLSNIYNSSITTGKIQTIMVAPLKALLNDLELRILDWLIFLEDLTIFKWHGDVSAFHKNKQRQKPASILLTTPESLDVMLVSQKIDNKTYFEHVHSVIVDEAHYFAGDSRGAQLSSILERIQKYVSVPIQRIGLSATIGDPDAVAQWLSGSGPECIVVKAEGQNRSLLIEDILIDEEDPDYGEILQNTLASLTRQGKTIVFSNSKREVELTARLLEKEGIRVMVHHGSVSKLLREEFEGEMRDNPGDAVISATSTLELGIDIGGLNRVIQKGNLPSVNSFLQRIGRAGRVDGKAHIGLVSSSFEEFILNMAMATLGMEQYFEPLRPSQKRYDILLQQLLLEILSNFGISVDSFYEKIKMAYPFREILRSELDDLIRYWEEKNLIQRDGIILIIGPVIEKKYGSRNYMELYSVFDVNEFYTVFHQEEEIGLLESWFAFSLTPNESVFQLAGRKWRVIEVVQEIKRIYVNPAKDALPPSWSGGGNFSIEYAVARRFQDILAGSYKIKEKIIPEAYKTLEKYKRSIAYNPILAGQIGISQIGKKIWIETYAGSMINNIISFHLMDSFPKAKIIQNFYRLEIEMQKLNSEEILKSLVTFCTEVTQMDQIQWNLYLGRHLSDFQYSRFSEYIPTKYSIYYAASAYFILEDMKGYIKGLHQNNFIFCI